MFATSRLEKHNGSQSQAYQSHDGRVFETLSEPLLRSVDAADDSVAGTYPAVAAVLRQSENQCLRLAGSKKSTTKRSKTQTSSSNMPLRDVFGAQEVL
jgi:hypothetical protein